MTTDPTDPREEGLVLPPKPRPIVIYPAEVVDAYIEQAEATIARLQRELAAALERAGHALLALSGDLSPAAGVAPLPELNPVGLEATHSDPLAGFLEALHDQAPSGVAEGRNRENNAR